MMVSYTMALYGTGGKLGSHTAWVMSDDMDGLRERLVAWLREDCIVLSDGHRITIEAA